MLEEHHVIFLRVFLLLSNTCNLPLISNITTVVKFSFNKYFCDDLHGLYHFLNTTTIISVFYVYSRPFQVVFRSAIPLYCKFFISCTHVKIQAIYIWTFLYLFQGLSLIDCLFQHILSNALFNIISMQLGLI